MNEYEFSSQPGSHSMMRRVSGTVLFSRSTSALQMSALPSPRLPLSKLMELGLHRLHPRLDVVPAVPRRLVMKLVVDLVDGRPLLPGRGGGGGGGGRAGDGVELVVAVHAAGVHRRGLAVAGFGRLILKLEPAADEGRGRRPVGGRPPLGHRAAAPRALVLLRRVLAAEARAARPALGRGLEVGRGGQLGGGPRVPRVPRRQPRPRPARRLGRRGGGQRLDRHEPPRLGVYRLEGGQLLAVALVHAAQLQVVGRRRERPLPARGRLPDRAQVAEVQRRPRHLGPARRARQKSRRRDRAHGRRYPRAQRVHRPVVQVVVVVVVVVVVHRGRGDAAAAPAADRDAAPVRPQAELAGADQRPPPRRLGQPLPRQETAVVAARRVQDAVVGRAEGRVGHHEAAVRRPRDLTQWSAAARVGRARVQNLPQEIQTWYSAFSRSTQVGQNEALDGFEVALRVVGDVDQQLVQGIFLRSFSFLDGTELNIECSKDVYMGSNRLRSKSSSISFESSRSLEFGSVVVINSCFFFFSPPWTTSNDRPR